MRTWQVLVLMAGLLMAGAGCATQRTPVAAPSTAAPVAAPAAPAEKYQLVKDPTGELGLDLELRMKSMTQDNTGRFVGLDATVASIKVSGKPLALRTQVVGLEDGYGVVDTRDYGKIRISSNAAGTGASMWLTPTQLGELKKLHQSAGAS